MHRFKIRLISTLAILLALFLQSSAVQAQDAAKLFKANCASCHKPTDQKLVGPGLKGIRSRWPDEAKLIAWIKNSTAFLATGDAYANKLFEEYGKSVMPAQNLSDADILAIIDWTDKGGDAPVAPAAGDGQTASAAAPAETSSDTYAMVLLGVGIILLVLVSVLGSVKSSLESLVNEKKGIVVEPKPVRTPVENFKHWASETRNWLQ